ncbi:MAG: phosphodiester glycosidase family protein [Chitinophagales bacterium]
MKRRLLLGLFLSGLLIFSDFFCLKCMAAGVTHKDLKVKTSYGVKQVRAVYIDLNDPSIQIYSVLAKGSVKQTESLASMAKRNGAVAAINGTFFASYSDMQPQGNLQINGLFQHLSNSGSSVGFTANNQVRFATIHSKIDGKVDGPSKSGLRSWEQYLKNWYAWGINRTNTDPKAIMIYTPAWGAKVSGMNGTKVAVSNGIVTAVSSGDTAIPSNGYVINIGSGSSTYVGRFSIGDTVSYSISFTDVWGSPVDWSNVINTVGAGPMLVVDGQVDVDPLREGMKDPKITSNSGARSFIGVTPSNQLVMATTPGATTKQLAAIAQKMGLSYAMNLDGGASSGLYYKGKYITSPGRNLSNCLVVKLKK